MHFAHSLLCKKTVTSNGEVRQSLVLCTYFLLITMMVTVDERAHACASYVARDNERKKEMVILFSLLIFN